jgi:hypothetical protein
MTPPSSAEFPAADPGRPGISYSPEPVWSSRTQWGAILVGAFAGFVVLVLMTTLGAALGVTAGAIGVSSVETVNAETAEKSATAFTIGAAIWMLLTALVTGLVGGWALNATARRDRPYSSFIFGGVCWSVGLCLTLALVSPAIGGSVAGLGGAAAAITGQATGGQQPGMFPSLSPRMTREAPGSAPSARPDAAPARPLPPMTDEEKTLVKDAAEKATAAATGAAWVILGSQLISIAATIFAAGWNRHTGARVVTEIRPRPAPIA